MSHSNEAIKNKSDMLLSFGKHKGQELSSTPKSYQDWLSKQDWFNSPKKEKSLSQKLNGWDGHSRKGQAIYDAIFEQEKAHALKQDCVSGICSCCPDSKYYGI